MGMRWYLSDGFTCEIRSRIIDLFSYFSCPHFISPKVWRIWNINLILHFLNSKKYIFPPQLHLFLMSDMSDIQRQLCRSLFFLWKAVKLMVHLINNGLLEPRKYSIIAAKSINSMVLNPLSAPTQWVTSVGNSGMSTHSKSKLKCKVWVMLA